MAGLALVMLGGCVTSEERAAKEAEQTRKVAAALAERHYKIDVNTMLPLRGGLRHVSYGYMVEVRNDSLISYLPYFGQVYSAPYGGGKGLHFSERIGNYQESVKKNGTRHIEIDVRNDEDVYLYTIDVFGDGRSEINVQPRQRDRISYSGEMTF
jgi:hypothetical protein